MAASRKDVRTRNLVASHNSSQLETIFSAAPTENSLTLGLSSAKLWIEADFEFPELVGKGKKRHLRFPETSRICN